MQAGAPIYLAPFELRMPDGLPEPGSGDAAKLGERYEDDSGGGVELGRGDLDHRGVTIAQFENAAARAGGRVVYRLEQLDAVEGGDLSHYGHGLMLGAWVRGHEPRGGVRVGVVPSRRDRRGAVIDREPERWLQGPQPNPHAWIPFGGGVRRCTGAAFAEMQLREVLHVAADLTIRPVRPQPERARRSLLVVVPDRGGEVLVG
jgi:Cytochrome P450